jgi:hypothetical protein
VAEDYTTNHRRYCFLKYRENYAADDDLWYSWDAKRKSIAGTELPASFPARTALLAAGYLVLEEIQGASETELITAGLRASQAAAVVAALE